MENTNSKEKAPNKVEKSNINPIPLDDKSTLSSKPAPSETEGSSTEQTGAKHETGLVSSDAPTVPTPPEVEPEPVKVENPAPSATNKMLKRTLAERVRMFRKKASSLQEEINRRKGVGMSTLSLKEQVEIRRRR